MCTYGGTFHLGCLSSSLSKLVMAAMTLRRVVLGVGDAETATLEFGCADLFRLGDGVTILCISMTGHLAQVSIIE